MALSWDELAVGEAGESWRTVSVSRRVLVVVHNVTAATRLLDVVSLWSGDSRVQTVFACTGSSAFDTGTSEFLSRSGIVPISWETAVQEEFSVAVAASYGGALHEIKAPLIILPHGMGYNKFLQPRNLGTSEPRNLGTSEPRNLGTSEPRVFGLSAEWLLHDGAPVASAAVLSHEEQRERLSGYCPEAESVALVAGDPCFDRMLAGMPLRESYRHRFGIRPEQRCVVVSSTWGPESLFGRDPSLVQRLARELPLDEYRIVVALHPNVWHGHSPWQVRMWLADCAEAGVLVLPPEEGWRAALIAADVTVGDHSSVGFYSAALDTPLLLASWPVHTVDPASPVAALLRTAPRLRSDRPLRGQIDEVVAQHTAGRHAEITALTTSAPGRSAELLRAEIYSHLELPEPAEPACSTAVPLPDQRVAEVPSQIVQVCWETGSVARFPASALGEVDGVLVAGTREPQRRWLELADVVLDDAGHQDPLHWIRSTLDAMPGCLLGATRDDTGDWVITGRGLPVVGLRLPRELGAAGAAVVHEWLKLGRPDFPARIRLGRRVVELEGGPG